MRVDRPVDRNLNACMNSLPLTLRISVLTYINSGKVLGFATPWCEHHSNASRQSVHPHNKLRQGLQSLISKPHAPQWQVILAPINL